MELTLTVFVTLDGVYQAPGEPGEDRDGGFDKGGWQVPFVDGDMMDVMGSWFSQADAFLFGRRTYEIFAGYWPQVTDPGNPIAEQFNRCRKYVATRGTLDAGWAGTTVLTGDVVEAVRELKFQPGRELQMHGCGDLAQTLMRHGLIDEYRILTHPVVVGPGKRLFREDALSGAFDALETTTTGTGVVVARYRPTGEVKLGDFAIGELEKRGLDDFEDSLLDVAQEARNA